MYLVLAKFNINQAPSSHNRIKSVLYFALFVFVIVIVLLNVLIAIVSDSYAAAMSDSRELFW